MSATRVGPWETWTNEWINQTRKYNREKKNYFWDKDSVSIGDYIRNDTSDVDFLESNQLGAVLYPKYEKGERQGEFNISNDQS